MCKGIKSIHKSSDFKVQVKSCDDFKVLHNDDIFCIVRSYNHSLFVYTAAFNYEDLKRTYRITTFYCVISESLHNNNTFAILLQKNQVTSF